MSADGGTRSRKKSKTKGYVKPALPLNNENDEEEPIHPLSPVLCNHHYPKLALLQPEDHGLYWVSPQCHGCDDKPKRRRNRKQISDGPSRPYRTVRCAQSQDVREKCADIEPKIRDRTLTAKEKFIYQLSKSPYAHVSATVLVPETPTNEQGLTLKEKLLRKSKRLQEKATSTRNVED